MGASLLVSTGRYSFEKSALENPQFFPEVHCIGVRAPARGLYAPSTCVEQYTEKVNLEAGKEYPFVVETENYSTGAAKMQLYWKTPSIFEREKTKELSKKEREVYLPTGVDWYDFWTGKKIKGGVKIMANAPIEIMP